MLQATLTLILNMVCWSIDTLISLISTLEGCNKRGGGAKVPKLINEEIGINVEGEIFLKN